MAAKKLEDTGGLALFWLRRVCVAHFHKRPVLFVISQRAVGKSMRERKQYGGSSMLKI